MFFASKPSVGGPKLSIGVGWEESWGTGVAAVGALANDQVSALAVGAGQALTMAMMIVAMRHGALMRMTIVTGPACRRRGERRKVEERRSTPLVGAAVRSAMDFHWDRGLLLQAGYAWSDESPPRGAIAHVMRLPGGVYQVTWLGVRTSVHDFQGAAVGAVHHPGRSDRGGGS